MSRDDDGADESSPWDNLDDDFRSEQWDVENDIGFDESYYDDGPSRSELAEMLAEIRETKARREREEVAEPSLREFFVHWDDITFELVEAFRERLDTATTEPEMQEFLDVHPSLLIQPLGGGHGRWLISKKRLGSEHVTDFMIAEKSTIGFEWTAVELEGPQRRLFNKNGDPNKYLNHAYRQITDWRTWLARNRDYAERTRDKDGLGLVDVGVDVPGWIIIGRRVDASPETHDRRRLLSQQWNIKIHSYAWLLERAEARSNTLTAQRLMRERASQQFPN